MPEKKTTNSIHEEHRARMQERVARDGLTSLAAHEVLEYLFCTFPFRAGIPTPWLTA